MFKRLNLSVFNTITRINESNTLIKHTSCGCKFKFDGNKHRCKAKIQENTMFAKKIYILNSYICTGENGKYLRNITGDSVTTCNEAIEVTKPVPTKTCFIKNCSKKFYQKNSSLSNEKVLYFTHIFINCHSSSIYYYLIKHESKRKHLLPYYDTSNKLKEFDIKYAI